MVFLEFYKRHFAYKYWSPGLQTGSYTDLRLHEIGVLIIFFIIYMAIINGVPIVALAISMKLHKNGKIGLAAHRILTKSVILLLIFGTMMALNETNNAWLEINN